MTDRRVLGPGVWQDRLSSIEERAVFLEGTDGAIMAHLHLPSRLDSGAGVLVCSPTDREQMRHYRRDALLARSLAAAGLAVARFDYRGTGNSDPLDGPRSLETMEEDIGSVARWFTDVARLDTISFVAESLAALPAARVARAYPTAPIAFLEPVVRPAAFYRHLQRTRLVAEARDGASEWPLRRSLAATLSEEGWADILGYRLDASAYEAAVRRDLLGDLGRGGGRPVAVVQVDKRSSLRPELARLEADLAAAGFVSESIVIATEHAWWYIPEWRPELATEENVELLPRLTAWFTSQFAPYLTGSRPSAGERVS